MKKLLAITAGFAATALAVFAQGTAFTYQGRLNDTNGPATGSYDLTFSLFGTNTSGVALAGPVTNSATAVSNGLFNTLIDFGRAPFATGTNLWLEIGVSTNGANSFSTLAPRQPLTPVPYALYALTSNGLTNNQTGVALAGTFTGSLNGNATTATTATSATTANTAVTANNFSSPLAGDVTGPQSATVVTPTIPRLGGTNLFTGTNAFAGVVIATNPTSQFIGVFTGNLAGNAATATTAVSATTAISATTAVTANNFSSPLAGDVTGPQNATVVTPAIPRLNGTNVFTGTNTFAGVVNLTNVNNTYAGSGAGLTGLSGGAIAAGSIGGAAIAPNAVNASQINSGQVVKSLNGLNDAVVLQPGANVTLTPGGNTLTIAAIGGWNTNGNAGTVGGVNFLGTTDNQPLELRVNGGRALRLEPGGASSYVGNGIPTGAPNMIGGASVNFVAPGVVGAFIGGGGTTNYFGNPSANSIASDLGSIGGGSGNTIQPNAGYSMIGGGAGNTIQANAIYSMIGGGAGNTIQTGASSSMIGGGYVNTIQNYADYSTIGGGSQNTIQNYAYYSTIGGGYNNTIQNYAYYSTIGGGFYNTNTGSSATIPGGDNNVATNHAFAAGHYAQANHTGSFVWADSSANSAFADTATNQFLIRASGGVGINTASPSDVLDVNGGLRATGPSTASTGAGLEMDYNGASSTRLFAYNRNTSAYMDINIGNTAGGGGIFVKANGNVGIGTTSPDVLLSVNGTADKPGGGSWSTFSDGRLKNVGTNFTHGLEALDTIQPVHYHYKSDNALNLPSQPDYVGVVAQQVQQAIPEAVSESKSGYLTVNNDPIIWTMFNAIKELKAENEALKARLNKLEKEKAGSASADNH